MSKKSLKDYTERVQLFAQLENFEQKDFFFKYTQFTESMKEPFSKKHPNKVMSLNGCDIKICDYELFDEFCKNRIKESIEHKSQFIRENSDG